MPLLVGALKNMTDVHFPGQTRRYGGKFPHGRLLDPYPARFLAKRYGKGHGFPAAHASGGFALPGLAFLVIPLWGHAFRI